MCKGFAVLCVCAHACACVSVKNKVPKQGDKDSHMELTCSLMSSENLVKRLVLRGPSVLCSKDSGWGVEAV